MSAALPDECGIAAMTRGVAPPPGTGWARYPKGAGPAGPPLNGNDSVREPNPARAPALVAPMQPLSSPLETSGEINPTVAIGAQDAWTSSTLNRHALADDGPST